MRRFAAAAVLLLALALPASAGWTVRSESSVASGKKTCTLTSSEGLVVLLMEHPTEGKAQVVASVAAGYQDTAYLAWGEERFASAPGRYQGGAIFDRTDSPRLVELLASDTPPDYEWRTKRDRLLTGKLDTRAFADKYGECLAAMGWTEPEDDFRVGVESEPQTP